MKGREAPSAAFCLGNYYIIGNVFVYIADHNILWSYGIARS
jgi:hypothetical protein